MNSRNIPKDVKSKQIISKVDLYKLRSNFMLKKIFNYIKSKRKLEIMKYNKKLQKRLDLSFNDYKEYTQLYSSIEIELRITNNEDKNKFINISSNNKKYYHIYFDDSKEEIKRNYFDKKERVKFIKIKIDYQIKSFKKLFYNCKCINSIHFKKFYRINITDMSYMFYGCSLLKELNLSNFNTNKVTNMNNMFY